MSGFDYGNARLRAMKARLLSRRALEALSEISSLSGLIAALVQTSYRKPVEAALARAEGMDCINEALHLDLTGILSRISSFFQDYSADLVAIVLHVYDLHNLITILRALSQHTPPGDILPLLLPVGDLKPAILSDLSRAPGPREMIDLLASMNAPLAQPLLQLRAELPGATVPDMELALYQWYFRKALTRIKGPAKTNGTLSAALKLDADIANLLTVIRLTYSPVGKKRNGKEHLVSNQSSHQNEPDLFVGPGHLSFSLLSQAASQSSPKAAIEIFANTVYDNALRNGLHAYEQSSQLSSFEKHLKRLRLDWNRRLIEKEPLGIGVLLGYLALKTNETGNLRWIANGINLGLKPDAIRRELELV